MLQESETEIVVSMLQRPSCTRTSTLLLHTVLTWCFEIATPVQSCRYCKTESPPWLGLVHSMKRIERYQVLYFTGLCVCGGDPCNAICYRVNEKDKTVP